MVRCQVLVSRQDDILSHIDCIPIKQRLSIMFVFYMSLFHAIFCPLRYFFVVFQSLVNHNIVLYLSAIFQTVRGGGRKGGLDQGWGSGVEGQGSGVGEKWNREMEQKKKLTSSFLNVKALRIRPRINHFNCHQNSAKPTPKSKPYISVCFR